MEIWKLSALLVSVFTLACSVQGLSFTLNRNHWISDTWEEEPAEEPLASKVASLLKRSKSHQFYGLMGKRAEVFQPVRMDRRRHKGDMFVGLMGKRSLEGSFTKPLLETSTDKSSTYKQSADLEEKWEKLLNY